MVNEVLGLVGWGDYRGDGGEWDGIESDLIKWNQMVITRSCDDRIWSGYWANNSDGEGDVGKSGIKDSVIGST